jgi:hypothetical protein
MRNTVKYVFLSAVVAFGASIAAHGGTCGAERTRDCTPAPAPEVDPSLVVAGMSLLAGTLVVVRSRFRKLPEAVEKPYPHGFLAEKMLSLG